MKRNPYRPFVLLLCAVVLVCCEKEEEFRICGTQCPKATPWTVESLNQGLPCFGTEEACIEWAATHGYSGKPCVQCD